MENLPDNSDKDVPPIDWREPFEWQRPPEWETIADLETLAAQLADDPKIEAALWLLYNSEKAAKLHGWPEAHHTVPAAEHYRHTYLWDAGFFVIMYSQAALFAAKAAEFLESRVGLSSADQGRGVPAAIQDLRAKSEVFMRQAVRDSFWVVDKQKPSGFIAGTQYADGWRWYEVEKLLSVDRQNKSTNYSQPAVLPLAVMSTYKAMQEAGSSDSGNYLEGMYRYMDNFMMFFQKERRNKTDPLIGVVDPHETGQDSATRWDHKKPERKPRSGPDTHPDIDEQNRYIDGTLAVMRQVDRFVWARNNQNRQRKLFWENDVSMNAIYFHNLQAMVWISREMAVQSGQELYIHKAETYEQLADELQAAMLDWTWFVSKRVPQKGFYNIKSDGEPNPDISPNNAFALLLPDLSEEQLEAVIDMMDEHFDVEFPSPSTSIKNPGYDPGNQEADRLWRGSKWNNTDYYLVEFGLLMHANRSCIRDDLRQRCDDWARRITSSSNEVIDMNHPPGLEAESALSELALAETIEKVKQLKHATGAHEHFHPHKGTGQRLRVKNFGWTWLARFMTYAGKV
jgi:hypothetical protein